MSFTLHPTLTLSRDARPACSACGLRMSTLSKEVVAQIRSHLPKAILDLVPEGFAIWGCGNCGHCHLGNHLGEARDLDALAEKLDTTKAGVIRYGITLLTVAVREQQHGRTLGVVDGDKVVKEIVGVWNNLLPAGA